MTSPCSFRSGEIFFKVIYSDDGELVDGARTYVNHVGYVSNNGNAVVPFESTIAHKANLGSVWSPQYAKLVDGTFEVVIYEWDGAAFGEPIYENLEEPQVPVFRRNLLTDLPKRGNPAPFFRHPSSGKLWTYKSQGNQWTPQDIYESDDGIHWTKIYTGVIGQSVTGKGCNYLGREIIIEDGLFKLWVSATSDGNVRYAKVYYVTSPDGINWTSNGVVLEPGTTYDSAGIDFPCVVKRDGTYFMWYRAAWTVTIMKKRSCWLPPRTASTGRSTVSSWIKGCRANSTRTPSPPCTSFRRKAASKCSTSPKAIPIPKPGRPAMQPPSTVSIGRNTAQSTPWWSERASTAGSRRTASTR